MLVALAAGVLALAGLSLYALAHGARFGPRQATPAERALTQVRAQMGPQAEVRYVEAGRGRAACGYAGMKGRREAVAFVSRPNRILMSDDPLIGEFATLKSRYCPGFDAPARPAASRN
jgi:hypothetical protein